MLRTVLVAGLTVLVLVAGSHTYSASSNPVASSTNWTKFVDPTEQAFTVDVPQGWTVKGGMFRLGFSDERAMVDMTSADGRINVRLGDVAVPSYVLPSQYHAREGEVYDLGAQAQMVVARYHSGPEFAVLYSHVRFYQLCRNPRADADTAVSEFSVPDYLPAPVAPDQSSSGRIAYRCDAAKPEKGAAPGGAVVFAYARTALYQNIWGVTSLVSFHAPADQADTVRAIALHSARSMRLLPQWIERQKQLDAQGLEYQRARQQQRMAALGQQVQQFEARMQAMRQQVSAFERHQAAQAAQVEGFTNVLNGVTPTVDPLTGQARNVWTGPAERYWTNGVGDVINSNSQPNASWHEIQPTQ
jgi:hypothetical protein